MRQYDEEDAQYLERMAAELLSRNDREYVVSYVGDGFASFTPMVIL